MVVIVLLTMIICVLVVTNLNQDKGQNKISVTQIDIKKSYVENDTINSLLNSEKLSNGVHLVMSESKHHYYILFHGLRSEFKDIRFVEKRNSIKIKCSREVRSADYEQKILYKLVSDERIKEISLIQDNKKIYFIQEITSKDF